MTSRQLDEEAIFHLARKLGGDERREYLNQISAGDQNLRRRVEDLLEVHEQQKDFMRSAGEPAPTVEQPPIAEGPGHQIGRYKLLQKIGEGGFGVVFMAEQERPMRRKVALKIIKPGMDTQTVTARFEAERQALALMDHPNISKVLDGGATDSGRPYFVMELVKGVPVTEYCDTNKLTIRQRLELFIQVCQAVQHAHQKGIIHRDIKPSNVLVALYDGKPVPKIIDFGVAKAISQRLTERTMFTQYGQIVGTLEYMSPEQAQLNQLDVDTRSDIYSLGVLLYELLTGVTPFDRERLRSSAFEELLRILREDDPPKPSTRIGTLHETAEQISAGRATNPARLGGLIRGDLDCIVMKALEKDRVRRYGTASDLGTDVRRFLDDESIHAHAPTATYRVVKFARRNKGPVMVAIAFGTLLIAGLLLASTGFVRERRTADRLEQTLTEFRTLAIDSAYDAAFDGDLERATDLAELADKTEAKEHHVKLLRGLARFNGGDAASAILELEAINKRQESVSATAILAIAYVYTGRMKDHLVALSRLRALTTENDYDVALKAFAEQSVYAGSPGRIETLRLIVETHPHWAMARCYHAVNLAQHALDTEDLDLALQAIEHAGQAESSLHENPYAQAVNLYAIHAAFLLARRKNDPRTVKLYELHAQKSASLSDNMMQFVAWFYDNAGEVDSSLNAWHDWNLANQGEASVRRVAYIGLLVRCGDIEAAHEVQKDDPDDPWARLNECLLCVVESRNKDIVRICSDLLERQAELGPYVRSFILGLLLISGEQEWASKLGTDWLRDRDSARIHSQFVKAIWHFLIRSTDTSTELLQLAGSSKANQCMAHFYIGIRNLSENDVETAEKHFRLAEETLIYRLVEYQWAKVLRHRISEHSSSREVKVVPDGSVGETTDRPRAATAM